MAEAKFDMLSPQIIYNLDSFDFKFIYKSLQSTYWAQDRSFEIIEKCFRNSVARMLYLDGTPVAFARVITDYAVFAYVADVFVDPLYRGRGYSKILIDSLLQDEKLATITKWMLITKDSHKLYEKYGFNVVAHPKRYMEYFPNLKKKDKNC